MIDSKSPASKLSESTHAANSKLMDDLLDKLRQAPGSHRDRRRGNRDPSNPTIIMTRSSMLLQTAESVEDLPASESRGSLVEHDAEATEPKPIAEQNSVDLSLKASDMLAALRSGRIA